MLYNAAIWRCPSCGNVELPLRRSGGMLSEAMEFLIQKPFLFILFVLIIVLGSIPLLFLFFPRTATAIVTWIF